MAKNVKQEAAEPKEDLQPVAVWPVYASSIQLQGTGNDITLIFQRPRPATGPGGRGVNREHAIAEVVAVVTMSPGTAKDLMIVLQETLEAHEKEFGEISTPFTRRRAKPKAQ